MIRSVLKGVWQFCSYLFVPQRRPTENEEGDMKKDDRVLLLSDFLESKDYEGCQFPEFEMALENVEDGNIGASALYHLDNLFFSVFQRVPQKEGERTLFRFTGLLAEGEDKGEKWDGEKCYAFNDIKDGALTFSAPKLFNDPMDPIIKEWTKWRKVHYKDKDDKILYRLIDETLDKIRICCFVDPLRSDKKNSIPRIEDCSPLMWAHYANNHKGICIQYKINPALIPENEQWIIRLLDVDYKRAFPLNGDIPFMDSLCVKGGSWQYENETRLILYTRNKFADKGRRRVKKYDIEAVYMGREIEAERRNYLKNMLRGTSIKLYQMSFDEDDISKLKAHQINL